MGRGSNGTDVPKGRWKRGAAHQNGYSKIGAVKQHTLLRNVTGYRPQEWRLLSMLVNLHLWCTRIQIDNESNGLAMAMD